MSTSRPAPPTTTTTTTTTTVPAVQGTASVTPDCTGATVAMSGWAPGTYVELSLDGEPWLVVTQSGAWAWPQHPADGVHYWAAFLPDGTFVHGEFNTCSIEAAPTTTTTTVLIPEVAAVSASQSDAVVVTSTTEAPQAVVASVAVLPATGTTTAPLVGAAGTSSLLGIVLMVAALRRRLPW